MKSSVIVFDRPLTDREVQRIFDEITRREFIIGTAAMGAAFLVGCSEPTESNPVASTGPWSFTDDRGTEVTLPSQPGRFAAFSTAAAALAEFGLTPAAIFGWFPPESDEQLRYLDLSNTATVGTAWAEFNVEKLLSTDPEIIVGMYDSSDDTLYDFKNRKQEEEMEAIAPVVALDALAPLLDQIARWRELAESLGADVDAKETRVARDRFEAASVALEAAIAAKPGLKFLAVAPQPDGMNVVDPGTVADLTYYESLGMDLVHPEEGEWPGVDTLSYENLDKYSADVILLDAREAAASFREQLEGTPTWGLLPGVSAGQVGGWHIADPPGYRFYSEAMEELTELIERSQVVT